MINFLEDVSTLPLYRRASRNVQRDPKGCGSDWRVDLNLKQIEGYLYLAKIFEETAENERQHAKDHLLLLGGLGDTVANLKAVVDDEDYEVQSMYPSFVKDAEGEGETKAAKAFKRVRGLN